MADSRHFAPGQRAMLHLRVWGFAPIAVLGTSRAEAGAKPTARAGFYSNGISGGGCRPSQGEGLLNGQASHIIRITRVIRKRYLCA